MQICINSKELYTIIIGMIVLYYLFVSVIRLNQINLFKQKLHYIYIINIFIIINKF